METMVKFTPERQDELIGLCQNLIRTRSYSGEENEVVDKIKAVCLELGYDEVKVDKYGSVIGHIKGKRPGPRLLFDGHLDTVPVPEPADWTHEPFGGEIHAGKIYGRGASDMKGAVAAMICAAAYFGRDSGRDFAGDLYVVGSVHEECFEGVSSRSVSEQIKPDYVVIGEASNCNVKRGQKGRAEIVVETFGKPAHSANPHKGINAAYKAARLVEQIQQLPMAHHPVLGDGILELTDIKSSPYPGASVVPDYCKMTYDRRLLVDETSSSVIKPILDLIVTMQQEDHEFKANAYYAKGREQCYTGTVIGGERYFPAWLLDEQDEYVQKVLQALRETGLDPEITHYDFCTNGSHYAGEAGIKTIGFGPSLENLAHTIDEYIEIQQLISAARGYYAISNAILGQAGAGKRAGGLGRDLSALFNSV